MKLMTRASALAVACALGACASISASNTGGYPFFHPVRDAGTQAYVGDHVGAIDARAGQKASDAYLITVLTDTGTPVTISQASTNGLHVGDRVQIVDGAAQPY